MTLVLVLLAVGVSLSAFFSGSETGFYRVNRTRLVIGALEGDWISRGLIWLTNNPALFVATTLVGNNVANYLVSVSIVLGTKQLFGDTHSGEMIATLAMSPLLFVYGELLPKNLFYHAPYMLLRWAGPPFLLCVVLFSPIAAVLWTFGRVLEAAVGSTPLRVRLALARNELEQVFQEGTDVGVLQPSQKKLAQHLFANAARPVLQFSTPPQRVARIHPGQSKQEVYRMARRQRLTVAPVGRPQGEIEGYVRIVDLHLDASETVDSWHPIPRIHQRASHIAALIQLQSHGDDLAEVIDDLGNSVGILYTHRLNASMLHGD